MRTFHGCINLTWSSSLRWSYDGSCDEIIEQDSSSDA